MPEVVDLTGGESSHMFMTSNNAQVGTVQDISYSMLNVHQLSIYVPVEGSDKIGNVYSNHSNTSYYSNQGIYPTILNQGMCHPFNIGHTWNQGWYPNIRNQEIFSTSHIGQHSI